MGVQAIYGLVLGDGVAVLEFFLEDYLELFVPLLMLSTFLSAAILLYLISDVYRYLLYHLLYQDVVSYVVYGYSLFLQLCCLLNCVIGSDESDLNGRIYGIRIRYEVWMSIFERAKKPTRYIWYQS